MQSRTLAEIICTDRNTLVNSPTSSGKTVIYFMAILRVFLKRSLQDQCRKDVRGKLRLSERPLVFFLAPIKSLINCLS
ncbi:DEAD/DEAH box helicase, partial [Listeria monocytogenes]|uniref:DEAD/DEAH box helicase n=1 Tax=Listeria monocytogenes TaxID=1639 RepID=UPI003C6CC610